MGKIKNHLSVITGILETLCSGAIIYGWSSLNYVLTKEGYFNSSCNSSLHNSNDSTTTICSKQQYFLGLVFTLSVSISAGLCIVVGKLLDICGTWVLRSISSVLFTLSCIAIAYSSSDTSWILYPATNVIGVCGYVVLITNVQTANLFPNYRGLVTNVLGGALNVSLAVFTLVKVAYHNGYSLKWSFLLMSLMGPLMFIRTFLLLPKTVIPFEVPKDPVNENGEKSASSEESNLLHKSTNNSNRNLGEVKELKSYFLSTLYILGVVSFSIQVLRMNFFVETLNVQLESAFPHNQSLVSYNVNLFGILHVFCLVLGPFLGGMVDFLHHKYKNKENVNPFQAQMKVLVFQNLFSSVVVVSYSVVLLIPVYNLQYVSYILILFSENLAYSNIGLFILLCFPMEHYGTLYGLALLVSAIVTTLQFPLYYVAIDYFHSNFLVVDIILLLLSFVTLLHPIDLYRRSKQ